MKLQAEEIQAALRQEHADFEAERTRAEKQLRQAQQLYSAMETERQQFATVCPVISYIIYN